MIRALGFNTADVEIVVAKAASIFQLFSRWRKGLIRVDTPGTTQSNLAAFHWTRIAHPIYPFDAFAGNSPQERLTT